MRIIDLPGQPALRLEHLVLDLNGTLSDRGDLIPGVAERIARLASTLQLHLVTADTFGTATAIGEQLGIPITTIQTGDDKAALVSSLGADRTAAIGNGRNDVAMLGTARIGIAVVGPEGTATAALLAADVVCPSVTDALDLLLDDRLLVATLRS
jgi:P-type E1-E2 ATPase